MSDTRLSQPVMVCAHYYPQYVESCARHAADLCRRAGIERCVVVTNAAGIAPALADAYARHRVSAEVVVHDNTGLEFGAYQTGLDRALAYSDPGWILVVNDTFARHECHSRPMRRRLVEAICDIEDFDTPIAVGAIDSLPRSYSILGLRTNRWIRSHVFALNRGALRVMGGRLRCDEIDALVRGSHVEEEFLSDELDTVLATHLRRFLFHPEHNPAWYAAAALEPGNAAMFGRKARSILQEKYLGARLDAAAAIFIDTKPVQDSERIVHRLDASLFSLSRASRKRWH